MSKARLNSSQHHDTKGYAVFKWPHRTIRQTWDVWHNGICIEEFPTHAEAIAYAQQQARLTCTSCGRRMPYLEACIDGRPYCHPEHGKDCYQEVRWPGIYTQDVIDASKLLAGDAP